MSHLLQFTRKSIQVFLIVLSFTCLAGCTQDQEKESDPVPNIPEQLEANCLVNRIDLQGGVYYTMQYDQNKKLSGYTSFIPANNFHKDLTATFQVEHDNSGKISRIQVGARETIVDYDQAGRWIRTSVLYPPKAPYDITYPDYDSQGQITRISNVRINAEYNLIDTMVIDYAWQNGNVVKQIDYINNKPYTSTFEYDLTKEAKNSEYNLLQLYTWSSKPLSKNIVKKIIQQTDIPNTFNNTDITWEFNAEGYVTKATSVSNYFSQVNPPSISTYTYTCD